MKIKYCTNYEEMSQLAFDSVVKDLKSHPELFLCSATGNSPEGIYTKLEEIYHEHPEYFNELSVIKLDEWVGLKHDNPNSCEFYLREKILQPLHISESRYISFKSDADHPQKESDRIQNLIDAKDPIDICILGLGKNGHIGFNEPSDKLALGCHVAKLSSSSKQHEMTSSLITKPSHGLTLGISDIFRSKKIILLITGSGKKKIIEQLLNKNINTHLPASLLWLHKNVVCYIDSESILPKTY